MAKNTEMSAGKKIWYIILGLVGVFCVVAIGWWVWLQIFAPNKVVYYTHNVGEITKADGEGKKNVIEVRYFSNDNKNGLEMLEVKFNEFSDETKNMFYSQGLQFVADTTNDTLTDWNFTLLETPRPSVFSNTNWWGTYDGVKNGGVYMYASADDYATTLNDAQALEFNSDLLIELQNKDGTTDLYLMEFKGTNTKVEEAYEVAGSGRLKAYSYSDPYLLCKKIYEQVQSLANGTSQSIAFKFNDMFNFKYFEDGAYLSENDRETSKVDVRVNDYYVVKVEVLADGARKSSDSMFGNIKGSANLTLNGNYEDTDYFFGRSTLNCTNDCFDKVVFDENKVALKLKQEFIKANKKHKDEIELLVIIDTDALKSEGYEFVGFYGTGLDEFIVKDFLILSNGNLEQMEVA